MASLQFGLGTSLGSDTGQTDRDNTVCASKVPSTWVDHTFAAITCTNMQGLQESQFGRKLKELRYGRNETLWFP